MIRNFEVHANVDARVVRGGRIHAQMAVYGVSQPEAARSLASLLEIAAMSLERAEHDPVSGVVNEPFRVEIEITHYQGFV